MRSRVSLRVMLVMLVPFMVACATSSSQTPASATGTSNPASTTASSSAPATGATSIDEAVNAVWQAMLTRNEGRMQTYMGGGLLQQIGSQQFKQLMSCVPDGSTVSLADHSVETSGNNAKVTLTFNISSGNGTPTTVTKVWDFVHLANGTWLLLTLPGCPFK